MKESGVCGLALKDWLIECIKRTIDYQSQGHGAMTELGNIVVFFLNFENQNKMPTIILTAISSLS